MTFVFNLSLAGYLAALLFATANLFSRQQRRFASVATVVLGGGAIAQTVYLIMRWIAAGRAPFSNMFESLVLFAWAVVVVYLAFQARHRIPMLGAATALLAVLPPAYASTSDAKLYRAVRACGGDCLGVHVVPLS